VNPNLRIEVHEEIREEAVLRQQWNGLVERMESPQVFYTWEWATAVQRAYRGSLPPLLFLAYDDGSALCGVAALTLSAETKVASFLCATTGDYCDFLSSEQDRPAFVAAVLAELKERGCQDVVLTNLPADSGTVGSLRLASGANGYRFFARTAYVCAQVSLAKLERREGGSQPVLPRKKMLRRFLNAMGRNAPVRLEHARTWAEAEPILAEFMQSHVARFLAAGMISNLARPERREFLCELAKRLGERRWLALTRMMSGGQSFAWNYGFRFQDSWFWYQPTFDSALEKYSPGFCLLATLIEEATRDPQCKMVDLGLGAEEYKDRFSNQTRRTLYVTLERSAARHYRGMARYVAGELIKKIPKAESAARRARRHWKSIRERRQDSGLAATSAWIVGRLRERLWSKEEVFFYEWGGVADSTPCDMRPLDLNALASAAMRYVDDEDTLAYLLRAAARLRREKADGSVLIDDAGEIVHFAWVTGFDGFFLAELDAKVPAPSPDCAMIFDCWTPREKRGHGYYGRAVSEIARRMQAKGKKPWIFSAAQNQASIRGLEKAGFQRRYSLVGRRVLGWQRVQGTMPSPVETPSTEVSAHV
jgi:CelD/BcsL family acetyltransferase involved in cellulose biosynthesis